VGTEWVLSGISSLEKHTGVSGTNSDKRKLLYSFLNFLLGLLLINLGYGCSATLYQRPLVENIWEMNSYT